MSPGYCRFFTCGKAQQGLQRPRVIRYLVQGIGDVMERVGSPLHPMYQRFHRAGEMDAFDRVQNLARLSGSL